MSKLFRDIFTEDDGSTYCAARFCAVACVFAFIATTLIHVFNRNPVDFSQLGVGFGAVLGGSGVFIGAKAATQKES